MGTLPQWQFVGPWRTDESGLNGLPVAYASGGGTDAIARSLAAQLQGVLGQPVVVENKPGAGGSIAAETGDTGRPDGSTLVMGNQGPDGGEPDAVPALPGEPGGGARSGRARGGRAAVGGRRPRHPRDDPARADRGDAEPRRRPHLRLGLQRLGQPPGRGSALPDGGGGGDARALPRRRPRADQRRRWAEVIRAARIMVD